MYIIIKINCKKRNPFKNRNFPAAGTSEINRKKYFFVKLHFPFFL